VLCFIAGKTRTGHEGKPAEAALDRDTRREVGAVAREYLRPLRWTRQWRSHVVSVYYEGGFPQPQIELFKNAFRVS
jgi:hypothetical protein